ncbi:MAG TPA: hypothetical protein VGQ46_16555 [Thermoanaerobaculia bacterium]|jgi:MFS superfamily sulfate permease-like transporter|nr:hypothetical protein [Thermoanaerobaculia bacterium]
MQRVRRITAVAGVLFAFPAFAHGEEVLIFPATFLLLLVPAVLIVMLRWHHSRIIRGAVAALLLATNVVLWFSPPIPHRDAEFAGYDFRKAFAILLLGPIAMAAIAIVVCRKWVGRTRPDSAQDSTL